MINERTVEIIESLINTIEWLGGDKFEVESSKQTIDEAYDHLKLLKNKQK